MLPEGIIFLPLSRRGMGSGHIRRCLDMAIQHTKGSVWIVLEESHPGTCSASDWNFLMPDFPDSISVFSASSALKNDAFPGRSPLLAIFDRRSSRKEDILPWATRATPILLDDDGPARNLAPFVVDSIPGSRASDANVASPSLMNLPSRKRDPDPAGRILLSFGGEDPADITLPLLTLLLDAGIPASRIHLTLPPRLMSQKLPEGVKELSAPKNLKAHLGNYGMVLCSYGITAWEAIATGCAVITVDPGTYHASLSRSTGFPATGCMDGSSRRSVKKIRRRLLSLLNHPEYLIQSAHHMRQKPELIAGETLLELLQSLEAPEPRCTACGSLLPPVIARFHRKSYYRCPECNIIGLYRFEQPPENEYGLSYFESEYLKQYGKSYLEDFPAIKSLGKKRLESISQQGKEGGELLDIGCAFGPFLDAAREAGFIPHGIDVSKDAVAFVQNHLKIPAVAGRFPGENQEFLTSGKKFDIITLWYVIEHFPDLKTVLRALNTLLPIHGVLAIATPNGAGISARRSLKAFLETSPKDHYTLWTPRTARKLLSRYGFNVYKIRITGHHPERFGVFPDSRALTKLLGLPSRVFALGDTFEIYAVKERSIV